MSCVHLALAALVHSGLLVVLNIKFPPVVDFCFLSADFQSLVRLIRW